MGFTAFAPAALLPPLQAATPAAGFALQNGTPNIVQWGAPADGLAHRFVLMATRNVTSAETGGQVSLTYTPPGAGAPPITTVVAGGGSGVGSGSLGNTATIVGMAAPGTFVTLSQTSALTVGAATVNAELYGS